VSTVKLIAKTEPVGLDLQTKDLVAYIARVSNPSNQMNTESSPRLLKYLRENSHWSPFEHVSLTMQITTTRDIARQILRHRSFTFQEFSQRYATANEEPMYGEARLQDHTNRQNSIDTTDGQLHNLFNRLQRTQWHSAYTAYQTALAHGVAKEVARKLLPEGLTCSTIYMTGNLRSWIHYVELRSGNGTQKEHQEIARKCGEILEEILNG